MGEALGIDLRVAACAAARWRDGVVEPCLLGDDGAPGVATAELMAEAGGSPTQVVDAVEATRAVLAAVAARAVEGAAVEAVGVAYALTPDDGPRRLAEQAAPAAFGPAFVVPRPVAVAARLRHGGGPAEGDIAVLDMDGNDVEIAVVRTGRAGYDVLGTSGAPAPSCDTVDVAAHLDRAVTAFEALLAAVVDGNAGVHAVVAVGRSEWLDQLAVQVRVATGLEVTVDPEPALSAAIGAAVLAGGPETRGRSRVAGPAGAVAPLAVPLALSTTTSGPAVGSDVGDALGDALGDAPAGSGEAIGDTVGEAVGDGSAATTIGERLRGAKGGVDSAGTGAGGAVGEAMREAAPGGGLAGVAIGAAARRRRDGTRRRAAIGAGAAVAALLVVVGALAAFGGGPGNGGAADDVETGDDRTATTRHGSDRSSDSDDRGDPTTTVAASTDTALVDGAPADAVPVADGSTTTVAGAGTTADPGSPMPSGGATPTTSGGPGTPPPTTAPATPPDTAGPSVVGLARSTGVISENGFEFCASPLTSAVSASISDPSGVTSAAVTWSGNGDSGAAPMTSSGSTWTATVGPVTDDADLGVGQSATITWTVTALDGAGNATSVAGPSITVEGC